MKNTLRLIGIIVLVTLIGFSMAACGDSGSGDPSTPPHTHIPGAAATCTSAQTCTACGVVLQAASHTYGAWTVTTPPNFTTSTAGEETGTCSVCAATGKRAYPVYNLGDTGPGGGKIFYRNGTAFGTNWYYLEAAANNMATILNWASAGKINTLLTGTFGTAIGTGKANTVLILQAGNDPDAPAAKACVDYRGPNNKDDWFLPSKDELNEMYTARTLLSIPSSGFFWSSSQDTAGYAWGHYFLNGNQGSYNKDNNTVNRVRAVRAF